MPLYHVWTEEKRTVVWEIEARNADAAEYAVMERWEGQELGWKTELHYREHCGTDERPTKGVVG